MRFNSHILIVIFGSSRQSTIYVFCETGNAVFFFIESYWLFSFRSNCVMICAIALTKISCGFAYLLSLGSTQDTGDIGLWIAFFIYMLPSFVQVVNVIYILRRYPRRSRICKPSISGSIKAWPEDPLTGALEAEQMGPIARAYALQYRNNTMAGIPTGTLPNGVQRPLIASTETQEVFAFLQRIYGQRKADTIFQGFRAPALDRMEGMEAYSTISEQQNVSLRSNTTPYTLSLRQVNSGNPEDSSLPEAGAPPMGLYIVQSNRHPIWYWGSGLDLRLVLFFLPIIMPAKLGLLVTLIVFEVENGIPIFW